MIGSRECWLQGVYDNMLKMGPLLIITLALVLLLGVISLTRPVFDLKLWSPIRRATRQILEIARQHCTDARVFRKQGATKIDPRHLAFWIATATDNERDLLRHDPNLIQQFREVLVRVGYPPRAVPLVYFTIESQETVDRDYGGSWHELMEMP